MRSSLVTVRLRSCLDPNRQKAYSGQTGSGAKTTASPAKSDNPSKIYHLDSVWLRRAISHLEGPREADNCVLLKLLLPSSPRGGWAASYGRGGTAVSEGQSSDHPATTSAEGSHTTSTRRAAAANVDPRTAPVLAPRTAENVGVSPHPWTPKPLVTPTVDLFGDGDGFDRAGFESVMEYLSTGEVGNSFSLCRGEQVASLLSIEPSSLYVVRHLCS